MKMSQNRNARIVIYIYGNWSWPELLFLTNKKQKLLNSNYKQETLAYLIAPLLKISKLNVPGK